MGITLIQVGDFDLFTVIAAPTIDKLPEAVKKSFEHNIDEFTSTEDAENCFVERDAVLCAVQELGDPGPGVHHLNAPDAWPDWYLVVPNEDGTYWHLF